MLARFGPYLGDFFGTHRGLSGRTVALFYGTYLAEYLRRSAVDRAEYLRWLPIVVVARFSEGLSGFQDWLLATVREKIH